MDTFTIRLLIGCLLVWFIAQFIAALRAALAKPTTINAVIWFVFVLLVAIWIFFAATIPLLNFHLK